MLPVPGMFTTIYTNTKTPVLQMQIVVQSMCNTLLYLFISSILIVVVRISFVWVFHNFRQFHHPPFSEFCMSYFSLLSIFYIYLKKMVHELGSPISQMNLVIKKSPRKWQVFELNRVFIISWKWFIRKNIIHVCVSFYELINPPLHCLSFSLSKQKMKEGNCNCFNSILKIESLIC